MFRPGESGEDEMLINGKVATALVPPALVPRDRRTSAPILDTVLNWKIGMRRSRSPTRIYQKTLMLLRESLMPSKAIFQKKSVIFFQQIIQKKRFLEVTRRQTLFHSTSSPQFPIEGQLLPLKLLKVPLRLRQRSNTNQSCLKCFVGCKFKGLKIFCRLILIFI